MQNIHPAPPYVPPWTEYIDLLRILLELQAEAGMNNVNKWM